MFLRSLSCRYLPARASWPPVFRDSEQTSAELFFPSKAGIEPELGLACELVLVEMHLDKALASSMVRGRGGCKDATLGGSPPTTTTSSSVAPTSSAASASATSARAVEGGKDGAGGSDKAAIAKPNVGGAEKDCFSRISVHLESAVAARHLTAADRAMLQLKPFFFTSVSSDESEGGEGARTYSGSTRVDADGSLGSESEDVPWTMGLRWWWLCGLRRRHAGEREGALDCFRRCERMLKCRSRACRGGSGGLEGEDEESTVVLLPYCAAHSRIDLQVVPASKRLTDLPECVAVSRETPS